MPSILINCDPNSKGQRGPSGRSASSPGPGGARVLYATQGATDPPTFTLFTNRSSTSSYVRYLERALERRLTWQEPLSRCGSDGEASEAPCLTQLASNLHYGIARAGARLVLCAVAAGVWIKSTIARARSLPVCRAQTIPTSGAWLTPTIDETSRAALSSRLRPSPCFLILHRRSPTIVALLSGLLALPAIARFCNRKNLTEDRTDRRRPG